MIAHDSIQVVALSPCSKTMSKKGENSKKGGPMGKPTLCATCEGYIMVCKANVWVGGKERMNCITNHHAILVVFAIF